MKMKHQDCQNCHYYDKLTGFCGVCYLKILKEMEKQRGVRKDGDGQNESESDKQTV